MTFSEVIKAAEICTRCGEFGDGTCKGAWKTNPKDRRAYFEKGESKNCPFDGKKSCHKVLAKWMLSGLKQLFEEKKKAKEGDGE